MEEKYRVSKYENVPSIIDESCKHTWHYGHCAQEWQTI